MDHIITEAEGQAWWFTPVIPELQRQEDLEFKASLGYWVRNPASKN